MPTRGGARRAAKKVALRSWPKPPIVITVTEDAPATSAGDSWQYWLVQRIIPTKALHKFGIDRHFIMDYMENAEFEGGAIPRCVKHIRAAGDLQLAEADLQYHGKTKTVYFIGAADKLDQYSRDMQAWLDKGMPSKEYTQLGFHFEGSGEFAKYKSARAWLSLKTRCSSLSKSATPTRFWTVSTIRPHQRRHEHTPGYTKSFVQPGGFF